MLSHKFPFYRIDYFIQDVFPDSKVVCGEYELKGGQFLGAGRDSVVRTAECVHTGKQVAVKR